MKKYLCFKCGLLAVWCYMPKSSENDSYYCDNCVSRGCSCNLIDYGNINAIEQERDNKGRLLPCIEYHYSNSGFYE